MTDEPIFDRLDEAWHGLVQHGRQDADGVRRVWENLTRRNHDNETATPAVSLTGKAVTSMDLIEIADRWKADAEAEIAKAKAKIEQDLPFVAQFAQAAAGNPLVSAALSVVHLSPEFLQSLATLVTNAESKLAAEKQAADEAAAAQQAALDAANPPASEPAPADPAADPSAAMA